MSDPIFISEYDELIREVLAGGGEFRLYPHGSSMLPLLRQGRDSVALRLLDRAVKPQDILFYQRQDGSYVLHRVKACTPDGMTLWGDNQFELEYGVTQEQIIGYVARIFREERELDQNCFAYRFYLRIWSCRILRRILLPFIYRLRNLTNQVC